MLSQTKVYMAVNRTCHSINGLSLENTGGAKKKWDLRLLVQMICVILWKTMPGRVKQVPQDSTE